MVNRKALSYLSRIIAKTGWLAEPEVPLREHKRLNVVYVPEECPRPAQNGSVGLFGTLTLAHDSADNESDICRAFTQPAHEVREPFTTEWNVDADPQTIANK